MGFLLCDIDLDYTLLSFGFNKHFVFAFQYKEENLININIEKELLGKATVNIPIIYTQSKKKCGKFIICYEKKLCA